MKIKSIIIKALIVSGVIVFVFMIIFISFAEDYQGRYILYISSVGLLDEEKSDYCKHNNPWSSAGGGIQDEINNPEVFHNDNEEKKREPIKSNVKIIDILSDEPLHIIEWFQPGSPFWLAMSDKGILYVADSGNYITVIDTESYISPFVCSCIPIRGGIICDIALGNSDKTLFCILAGADNSAVGVIDIATESLIKTVELPLLKEETYTAFPVGIDVDDNYAYIVQGTETKGEVVFINSLKYTLEGTVSVGVYPFGLAVTPDGKKLYVANRSSGNVSVIDIADKKVIATIEVEDGPVRVAITPDGSKAYVANRESNSVSVVDIKTDTVVTTLPAGEKPLAIAISGDGKRAFTGNQGSCNVTVIDVETDTILATTVSYPESVPFDLVAE